ncbi:MAG: hypothetical protein Q9179_006747 [Wetmoreana sp. 5 TL-2023]
MASTLNILDRRDQSSRAHTYYKQLVQVLNDLHGYHRREPSTPYYRSSRRAGNPPDESRANCKTTTTSKALGDIVLTRSEAGSPRDQSPHVGKRQHYRNTKKRLRSEDEEIASLTRQRDEARQVMADQEYSLGSQGREIAVLRRNLSQKEHEVQSLQQQIDRQKTFINELNTTFKESQATASHKEHTVQSLQQQIDRQNTFVNNLDAALKESQATASQHWRLYVSQQTSIINELVTALKESHASATRRASRTLQSLEDCQRLQSVINTYDHKIAALSAKYSEHDKRLKELPKAVKLNMMGRFGITIGLSFAEDKSEHGDLAPVPNERPSDAGPRVEMDTTSRGNTILIEDVSTRSS